MTRRQMLALLSSAAGFALTTSALRISLATMGMRDSGGRAARGIAYGSDPRQRLDVFSPDAKAGKRPVVVHFYGEAWTAGIRRNYAWVGEALARHGFVGVVPDYRLAPEFVYPAFVQDGAAAVRWVQDHIAQYGGDPERILLMGHSAGAHIAMQLALDDDFLRAAGVDFGRIRGVAGFAGPYQFYPFVQADRMTAFAGYPDPRAAEPITYAGRPNRPPVLLIQGGKDDDVMPRNAILLDRALKAAGNDSTLRIYPELGHLDTILALSPSYPFTAPQVLEETMGFLNKAAG